MELEPDPQKIIDVSGPKGETIFYHALAHTFTDQGKRLQSDVDEMWAHYKDVTDERLLALVAALCVETAVQNLLESFSSGFAEIADDSACTFSLKIKMARSMRLIPTRIFSSCDLIRQIRNEFAHHLEKKELNQLDARKYLNKMSVQLAQFNPAEVNQNTPAELLKQLVSFTIFSLSMYTQQVRRLRQYLDTTDCQRDFMQWSHSEINLTGNSDQDV